MTSPLIDEYIIRLSIRKQYHNVIKEISLTPELLRRLSDIDIALLTISCTILKNRYNQFVVAIKLLELFRENFGVQNFQIVDLLERVLYFTKLMHLVSRIGRQASSSVLELMSDYFPMEESHVGMVATMSQSVYSVARTYVLKILLKEKRSIQFADTMFPESFLAVTMQLHQTFTELALLIAEAFPKSELEQCFSQLSDEAKLDPAVRLYYEKALVMERTGGVNEEGVIAFLNDLRQTQSTLAPPIDLLIPVSCSSDLPIRSATPTDMGSQDIMLSPPNEDSELQHAKKVDDAPEFVVLIEPLDFKALGIGVVYDVNGCVIYRKAKRKRKRQFY